MDSVRRVFGATKQDTASYCKRDRLMVRRVERLNWVANEVFADLIVGRLPHLPSSEFDADVAWPQLAGTAQAPTGPSAPWPQPAQWRAAPPFAPS